jgi:CheY-like chemotaxis protein
VFVTARAEVVRAQALASGAVAVLGKPFTAAHLSSAMTLPLAFQEID